MKDFPIKISLTDFFGYFFPGMIFIVSIYSFSYSLGFILPIPIGFYEGIIGLAIVYLLGILSSSFVNWLRLDEKCNDFKIIYNEEEIKSLLQMVKKCFNSYFKPNHKWENEDYFIIRTIVRELSPTGTEYAERQNSLRQFKRNSIIPVFLICFSFFSWGIKLAFNGKCFFAFLVSEFSLVLAFIFPLALYKGMYRNRTLEVREYFTAFLTIFNQKKENQD